MNYKKLTEIAELLNGYAFKSKNYVDSGIRVIRIANVQDGYISDEEPCYYPAETKPEIEKYMLRENDILISLTGNVGRVGILYREMLPAALNQRVSCVRVNTDIVSVQYLYYYLLRKQFVKDCVKASKGVAQLNLSTKWLESYVIPLPSLHEQQAIVNYIETMMSKLEDGIETLKKTQQQLAIYRQAVLKEAFLGTYTHHSTVDLKLKWVSKEELMDTPNIPKEWRYVSLDQLGDLSRGKSKHRPRNDPKLFENGKYPFIQTGDVKSASNNCITKYSKKYGAFGLNQSKLWPKGTLCITIAANIAETAFLGIDACFPDSIVGFTPFDIVLSSYVKFFIESQKQKLWAFAPATAQKNINLTTLENLIIPYCSIREQKDIVNEIESRITLCENIEKTVDSAIHEAKSLRQSILKQAFEGEQS